MALTMSMRLNIFGKLLVSDWFMIFYFISSSHNKFTKLFHFFLLNNLVRALIYPTGLIYAVVVEHSFVLFFNLMYNIRVTLCLLFTNKVLQVHGRVHYWVNFLSFQVATQTKTWILVKDAILLFFFLFSFRFFSLFLTLHLLLSFLFSLFSLLIFTFLLFLSLLERLFPLLLLFLNRLTLAFFGLSAAFTFLFLSLLPVFLFLPLLVFFVPDSLFTGRLQTTLFFGL